MSAGVVGPYKDYILTYPLYQQDPKRRKSFEQAFPEVNDFMRLRDRHNRTDKEIAMSAASSLLGMAGAEGAPEWLRKAMQGG